MKFTVSSTSGRQRFAFDEVTEGESYVDHEFATLEELTTFLREAGQCIIDIKSDGTGEIKMYDTYRE